MKTKFDMQREKALKQLADARAEGKADEDITELIDLINSRKDFYTTSSCAGRICLLQTPMEHDKLESKWLGKWHKKVTLHYIKEALAKHDENVVYLQAECPILHVVARDIESAKELLFLAQQSGFKRSGIQSVNDERVLLELLSTEHLEVPIAENGKVLVDEEYLEFLVEVANTKWQRGREKLDKFLEVLSK